MDASLVDPNLSLTDLSSVLQAVGAHVGDIMDGDDDVSTPGSPVLESASLSPDQLALEKQRATLKTYVDSVPYECEPEEVMLEKLEDIVGKLYICVETKNWLLFSTWDGALQCWLLMRYPVSKSLRAKLIHLYYELCLLPGIEPRITRSWADMLSRLLASKSDSRRKLEPQDLQLPWKPLWKVLQKELWIKSNLYESSRNVVNILLFVAEQCKRYYPSSEIPEMLSTFIPLLTQDTYLTMIPAITSFLPPTHTHLYIPALFKIWEAFNSAIVDDRMINLVGELSEEHVAGTAGDAGAEGGAPWKDVGIWTQEEWTVLIGKALGSMNVPVGATRGASTTGGYADTKGDHPSLRIKKPISRSNCLARMIVYSMAVDGPVRVDTPPSRGADYSARQEGFLAGSKAMDSLDRLITSTESFFHPSNSGLWTMSLTSFLSRVTYEFGKRWKEEEQPSCKTPVGQRLTPAIRRALVLTLRTPALLAMFSKDPLSAGFAQNALRYMALLEPSLIMPELLERAYSGLEVVLETHRTIAVLAMLAGVALPLASEQVWLGGQKHIAPLLELCIPGIDLNDPTKTVCASAFIVAVCQHIKIGDLSMTQSGLSLSGDAPPEDSMDVDEDTRLPDGTEGTGMPVLSKAEERTLARESTASFADWVTSLFRRILALYENLPEEGGKKNTTGGKQEESVLRSLKNTLDVVCLHLSDPLFDLVLKLVFEYATSTAKSNAVKAFGQMVSSLARAQPQKTIDKFFPWCKAQIEEELKHGASSIRTTTTHVPVPSDTTLHWNIAILRGCFGYEGKALLKHKDQIIEVLSLLVEKTLSERGYGGSARLIARIMATLTGVYPLDSRFVNTDEWNDPEFDKDHNLHWGKMYEAKDVKTEWHVPSAEEISFALEILDKIVAPALDKIETLLNTADSWDNVARNDFCRYLHVCRSTWSGLSTFIKEGPKEVVQSCLNPDLEVESLVVKSIDAEAGFALADPADPRYQRAAAHRQRFGRAVHKAATALGQGHEGEDHIDAVLSVAKAIDVYMSDYALGRTEFDALQKNYSTQRNINRLGPKQKQNARLVWMKRAQVYHSGRVYLHDLYRRRSELDDQLLTDTLELSISSYVRVRRHAQAVLNNICGLYVRSTRLILPMLFDALAKGTDADRMKGALYILWNKGIASYAIADPKDPAMYGKYLTALLESQHQEKPSIQKLIASLAQDSLSHLQEETTRTDAYTDETPGVVNAINALASEFSPKIVDQAILTEAVQKRSSRTAVRLQKYDETVATIVEIALRTSTHWRYVQIALTFLYALLRRDAPPSAALTKLFIEQTTSPHPTLRRIAQRGIIKIAAFVKIRTYSKTSEELWLDAWTSPLSTQLSIKSEEEFLKLAQQPIQSGGAQDLYIDQLSSGFLAWTPHTKAYKAVPAGSPPLSWETKSQPALEMIIALIDQDDYFDKLAVLWGQESGRTTGNPELRPDNILFIKTLAKTFQGAGLEKLLQVAEPLLWDADRFKQRAAAEIIGGLARGSKHWPKQLSDQLWSWITDRLDRIFAQIKPDTLNLWEGIINLALEGRDPRRTPALVSWVLSLPLDLQSDSAFAITKSLAMISCYLDLVGQRDKQVMDKYFNLFLDNCNIGYAEMRILIAQDLYIIITNQWRPAYPSVETFLQACQTSDDPLQIRQAPYLSRFVEVVQQLPKWKEERLPPPRVNQSQYDKVGLTLLRWMWVSFYSSHASLMFPYMLHMLPEFFRMSELSDDTELQTHSRAVLYILSAVAPPRARETTEVITSSFVDAIKSSTQWRIRMHALPALVVFFYRNLLSIPNESISTVMTVLLNCLSDDNVEVREMASKALSGIVRVSQRQSIIPLKDRFVSLARKTRIPQRQDPAYAESLRTLHSAILGLCALIESFPYSVESWMPPLTDILALHATDPPPISSTIRKCSSEFKKTHQDTWHKDQLSFDEDQLQNLSTMLVGTSYYA